MRSKLASHVLGVNRVISAEIGLMSCTLPLSAADTGTTVQASRFRAVMRAKAAGNARAVTLCMIITGVRPPAARIERAHHVDSCVDVGLGIGHHDRPCCCARRRLERGPIFFARATANI